MSKEPVDYDSLMNDETTDLDKLSQDLKNDIFSDLKPETKPTEEVEEEVEETEEKSDVKDTKNKTSKEDIQKAEDKTDAPEKEEKTTEKEVTPKKAQLVTVDKKYIESQDAEVRHILESIKGESLSPKALKNYIETQKYVAELKGQQKPVTQQAPAPSLNISAEAENIAREQFAKKYEGVPTDPKQFEEFLVNLNYEKPWLAARLIQEYNGTVEKVQQDIETYTNLAQNWPTILEQTVVNDIKTFEAKLESLGLTIADLGLDLNFDDNKYNKYLFDNIFHDEQGRNDARVINSNGDIVYSPQGAVYSKLLEKNLDKIAELVSAKKVSGATAQTKRTQPKAEPSVTSQKTGGFVPKFNINDISNDEELEREILRAKKEVLGK